MSKQSLNIAMLNGATPCQLKRGATGGGSSESGGDNQSNVNYVYFDVRGYDLGKNYDFLNILPFASFVNFKGNLFGFDIHAIISYGYISLAGGDSTNIIGFAIDEEFIISDISTPNSDMQPIKVIDMINTTTAKDLYSSLPRITKEQFYNLEA